MRNRPTARYILVAALFLSILTPMTGAHGNGALDNTFGNNDPKNGTKYGKLYNWHAVNDTRGLAPDGWIIPTFFYWLNLSVLFTGV